MITVLLKEKEQVSEKKQNNKIIAEDTQCTQLSALTICAIHSESVHLTVVLTLTRRYSLIEWL